MVKYKEQREKPSYWEVVDVQEAHVFYCGDDIALAYAVQEAITRQGHKSIVKEVTRK